MEMKLIIVRTLRMLLMTFSLKLVIIYLLLFLLLIGLQCHNFYMQNRQSNSIYLSPTSSNEIENEIDKLKSLKATGPYSIPITILKLLKTFISIPLEMYIYIYLNVFFSLLTGVVPNKFKIASVIPIFKKASHMIVNNYRPISLLSIFNQLLEKIVSKKLTSFIINHNILYSK